MRHNQLRRLCVRSLQSVGSLVSLIRRYDPARKVDDLWDWRVVILTSRPVPCGAVGCQLVLMPPLARDPLPPSAEAPVCWMLRPCGWRSDHQSGVCPLGVSGSSCLPPVSSQALALVSSDTVPPLPFSFRRSHAQAVYTGHHYLTAASRMAMKTLS